MANTDRVVQDPAHREQITLLKTAEDTRGALVQYVTDVEPKGGLREAHAHPRQEERVTVLGGQASFHVDGIDHSLRTGEMMVIRPGTVHAFTNSGDRPLRLLTEVRPALYSDEYLQKVDRLSRQGKLGRNPITTLLQNAVLYAQYPDELGLSGKKRLLLRVLAPVARWLGFRTFYSES